jgi:hypothetical protein
MNHNPIYNNTLIFGKEYTRKELDQITEIPTSLSDNRTVEYIDVIGLGNQSMINKKQSYAEFQMEQMTYAQFTLTDYNSNIWDRTTKSNIPNPNYGKVHKDYQHGIIPCVLIDDSLLSKKESNVKDRSMILLDFDAMGDKTIDDLHNVLANYQYFGWTTFNDQMPGKGRRYRVMMLMAETYATAAEWNLVKDGIVEWMTTNGFTLDKSGSLTYTQLGIGPAFNPAIDKITFFRNDVDNLISFAHLKKDPITKPAPALTKARTKYDISSIGVKDYKVNYDASWGKFSKDEELQNLFLDKLREHDCDTGHLNTDITINGETIKLEALGGRHLAKACMAIFDDSHDARDYFNRIWNTVHKDKKKYAQDQWDQAIAWEDDANTTAFNRLVDVMDAHEVYGFNKASSVEEYRNRCIREMTGDWTLVSPVSGGYMPDWIINQRNSTYTGFDGPTGCGKTYVHTSSEDIIERSILVVPFKSIVGQQVGTNKSYNDTNITTYDQSTRYANNRKPSIISVDEAHDLGMITYRANASWQMHDLLSRGKEGNHTGKYNILSATMYASEHKLLAKAMGCNHPELFKLDIPKRNIDYQVVLLKPKFKSHIDPDDIIMELITESVAQNKLVYVVRDNGKYNKNIRDLLSQQGIKVVDITSSWERDHGSGTYSKQVANDFINTSDFKYSNHNLQVILTTRYGCEGVNITDEVDNAVVIVCGDLPESYVKQSQGRFRNAKSVHLYHIVEEQNFIDVDIIMASWDHHKKGIEMNLTGFNTSVDRSIGKAGLVTCTQDPEETLLKYGYIYDKNNDKIRKSVYGDMIRYQYKADREFYQSVQHQYANMESWGCNTLDVITVSNMATVNIEAHTEKIKLYQGFVKEGRKEVIDNVLSTPIAYKDIPVAVRKFLLDKYGVLQKEFPDTFSGLTDSRVQYVVDVMGKDWQSVLGCLVKLFHDGDNPKHSRKAIINTFKRYINNSKTITFEQLKQELTTMIKLPTIQNLPINFPVGSKMTKDQAIEFMYALYNDFLTGFRALGWAQFARYTDEDVRRHWHSMGWMFHGSMAIDTGVITERNPLQWLEDKGFVIFDDNWSKVGPKGEQVNAKKVLWVFEYPSEEVKPVTDEGWDEEVASSSVVELH